jgi:quercetin dioxygenase-like cupin family protein
VPENLQLNHIARLKGKFPGVLIGFSTHEEPENTGAVAMAYALGAAIFERHVGVATDEYKLNAYSSDYDEVVAWIRSLKAAFDMLGYGPRCSSDKEDADLHRFKRGVYLRRNVAKGSPVTRDDVGFAFPNVDGQLVANDMSKYNAFVAKKNLTAGSPLLREDTSVRYIRNLIQGHVQELVAMVKDSNIIIGDDVPLEISHHYGIDNFEEYGLSMLTIMNTGDYCKKYLISLPGQKHPTQWHEEKKETFIVLYGTVCVNLGVGDVWYDIGDVIHIEPRMTHKFVGGPEGCIIEEISTTHHVNDSFYTDPDVAKNLNRKTFVDYWRNVK